MSHRAKSALARTHRAIAVVLTMGCLLAGGGSVAQADEFMLLGQSGEELPNTPITIWDQTGGPTQVIYSDYLGRFFVPYNGRVTTYQYRVEGWEGIGNILVTGSPGIRPVPIPRP